MALEGGVSHSCSRPVCTTGCMMTRQEPRSSHRQQTQKRISLCSDVFSDFGRPIHLAKLGSVGRSHWQRREGEKDLRGLTREFWPLSSKIKMYKVNLGG